MTFMYYIGVLKGPSPNFKPLSELFLKGFSKERVENGSGRKQALL